MRCEICDEILETDEELEADICNQCDEEIKSIIIPVDSEPEEFEDG